MGVRLQRYPSFDCKDIHLIIYRLLTRTPLFKEGGVIGRLDKSLKSDAREALAMSYSSMVSFVRPED